MAAIAAGKHVYCEKPLALTAAEAKEMYEAAEKAEVKTLVGFNYLRNPAIAEARRLIAQRRPRGDLDVQRPVRAGRLHRPGCAVHLAVRPEAVRQRRARRPGAHIISLAQVLVGPISSVAGLSKTFVKTRPAPTGAFGYGSGADLSRPATGGRERRRHHVPDRVRLGRERPHRRLPGRHRHGPGTRASRSSAARGPCSSSSKTSTPCGCTWPATRPSRRATARSSSARPTATTAPSGRSPASRSVCTS